MCICVYVYMCICVDVYMCICVYVYMYICEVVKSLLLSERIHNALRNWSHSCVHARAEDIDGTKSSCNFLSLGCVIFSPIARDWLKIRFCIGAASLRPCSVRLEYSSYAHWLLRLSTSISRQTNNHICSASYRKISAELWPGLRSRRERNTSCSTILRCIHLYPFTY